MSHLLDVNLLLCCVWSSHADHYRANRWLDAAETFYTAPIIQMGFLRVSLSPAYNASFDQAQMALHAIVARASHRFVPDSVQANSLPALSHGKEVTDAHLILLAKEHDLKLATLDMVLCKKTWALHIAENPLYRPAA